MDNVRALMRYNLQIVAANTLWVLIIPLIFTVLSVGGLFLTDLLNPHWTFHPSNAAGLAEGLMPILGAFICAHVLDVELRQGADEVLRSKARPLWRTVALRTAVGLLVVLLFGLLALGAARLALGEFSLLRVWLAAIPPTLFFAMLGLLIAMRMRNALLSLILPLILWFMDFLASWFFNPLLSLSTYKYHLLSQQGEMSPFTLFADWWWVSKVALGVVAAGLFVRVVTSLERGG
jgi:hypothetical protein